VLLGLCLVAFLALERLPFTYACKRREAEALLAAERSDLQRSDLRRVPEAEVPLALANVAAAVRGGGGGGGEEEEEAAAKARAKATPLALLPQLWAWALSLVLIYAVTLGLFPSLSSTIQSTATSCSWRHMFVPVGFVIYNAGDTIGRNLPGAVRSSRRLLSLTLLRTGFVPLFMMCNVVPSSGVSPLASPPLASDAWPMLVMVAFSLSNGWLTSCALMHAPEAVPPSERGRAGSLMICFLNGAVHVQCIHEARVAYPLSRSHLVRSQVFDIRQVRCAPTRGSSPPAVLHLRTWCMHCTWSCTCMLSGARQHMCKYCAYETVYMRPDASQHVGYMC